MASLRNLNIHATAEQIYEDVAAAFPSISKATVYRNLSQMAETGELINIGSLYGAVHYDHNCRRHDHFICDKCRQVFDMSGTPPNLLDRITGMDGFKITGYSLTFNGVCGDCRQDERNQ